MSVTNHLHYIANELNCSCFCNRINTLLTGLSRSVWENLVLVRVYRLNCVRSVLTTSVKIFPYRPPAQLIRAKKERVHLASCQDLISLFNLSLLLAFSFPLRFTLPCVTHIFFLFFLRKPCNLLTSHTVTEWRWCSPGAARNSCTKTQLILSTRIRKETGGTAET